MNWKNRIPIIILIGIILLVAYLQSYQIDRSVTGYHNQKEVHYLTEARNFERNGFFANGFFTPQWDYPVYSDNYTGVHSDTFPTTSIITALIFKVTGFSLKAARVGNMILISMSIIFLYLIVKMLFLRESLALLTALIFGMSPIILFFGRQVQLINAALFFCLVGIYFMIRWSKEEKFYQLVIFSLAFSLGVMTKYSFILLILPALFTLSRKNFRKDLLKQYTFLLIPAGLSIAWFLYSGSISGNIGFQMSSAFNIEFFQFQFWKVMKMYASDNYTLLGSILSLMGLILFWLVTKKNRGGKFIKSYIIFGVLWAILMSSKLSGHNYHQYPLVPLYALGLALLIAFVSDIFKLMKYPFIILILLALTPGIMESRDRMFDVAFIGHDVAGDYIREHSEANETIFHSSHQSYGVLWHADRKGFKMSDVLTMKYLEEKKNARWMYIYQWGFKAFENPEVNAYISQNYEIRQFAFIKDINDKITPIYILLEKGENGFRDSDLDVLYQYGDKNRKFYENSKGGTILYYIDAKTTD